MSGNIVVCDPIAPGGNEPQRLRHTLESVKGKIVGFIDNAKPNFHHLVEDLAEQLVARHGVAKIVKVRKRGASIPAEEPMIKEVTDQCDLVITGSGD
jgi:hypothetical protein